MGRERNGRKGRGTQGRGWNGREGRGRGGREGEGTGREGTPNILLHPQFQFSRNMPADSKYVVLDDPLPPGHVTWRMRIANFAVTK